MGSLFDGEPFAGFGPSRLHPGNLRSIDGRRPGQLKAKLRQECSSGPGVYGMIDGDGELIYVGKAKSLRRRLLSYFRRTGRPRKTARIVAATRRIVWETAASEFAALLRELELIQRWRPVFNVQGQPHRFRRTYLCLGRRPAPYLFLSRKPPRTTIGFWGPVFAGPRARDAVRRVSDWFGLRDCPRPQEMVFADGPGLFRQELTAGCLRFEIGTCLGPCAAACTRRDYADRVAAARKFLDGGDRTPLEQLRQEMEAAAGSLAFERAAVLREKLAALEWLDGHLERIRRARGRFHFVFPVQGRNGKNLWYLIRDGWVAAAVREPRTVIERQGALAAIQSVFSMRGILPAWTEEVDGVLLVSAWFERHPADLERVMSPEEALSRCRMSADRKQ
jgi:excinuclease ABC subunit C